MLNGDPNSVNIADKLCIETGYLFHITQEIVYQLNFIAVNMDVLKQVSLIQCDG